MTALKFAILTGVLFTTAVAADLPRPRGVGPEFHKFYKDQSSFACISSPTVKLSPSQVNDEFCDCPDGSDEPGTSACSYLSILSPSTPENVVHDSVNHTIVLPGFYCKNKGHNPQYIRFELVNDGICDYDVCCDGSDEYAGVGGVSCPDKCAETGKEWKKQDAIRQKGFAAALQRRKELIAEAKKLRLTIERDIEQLARQIEGGEIKIKELEHEKDSIAKEEASRVVMRNGEGGKISVLAGLAKSRIEELRAALIQVRSQRDFKKDRVQELEQILSTFREEYNPNFNDEGVKRAVRAWEEYSARKTVVEDDEARERELEDMEKGIDGIDWNEFENVEQTHETEFELLYKVEAYLPISLRSWINTNLNRVRRFLIDQGVLPDFAGATTQVKESQAVRDANQRLDSARNDLSEASKKRDDLQEDLLRNYGDDDVFRSLKGKCTSLDSGEYTYELCWLDKVTQKSKKGGAHNDMGRFTSFDSIFVDEGDVPADGKGLGTGNRVTMKYENGAHCWNGPSRSTTVVMGCSEHEEVWRVVEEEKCVYRMDVGTPAVCEVMKRENGGDATAQGKDTQARDEL